mmetsp:Transcript_52372/g.60151  ORF Transcript_52372/g.60151 Transcript_52372/m.60151 type:complete len:232 (-) Transcript_52372:58-753(-)
MLDRSTFSKRRHPARNEPPMLVTLARGARLRLVNALHSARNPSLIVTTVLRALRSRDSRLVQPARNCSPSVSPKDKLDRSTFVRLAHPLKKRAPNDSFVNMLKLIDSREPQPLKKPSPRFFTPPAARPLRSMALSDAHPIRKLLPIDWGLIIVISSSGNVSHPAKKSSPIVFKAWKQGLMIVSDDSTLASAKKRFPILVTLVSDFRTTVLFEICPLQKSSLVSRTLCRGPP